jgi:RND family efflux transporter MFP subunit
MRGPCARPRAWTKPGNRRRGEARIARAERDLRNTEISAPYAAVDRRTARRGRTVHQPRAQRLGRILGADKAEVRLPVPPQDIGFINIGSDAPVGLYDRVGVRERRWPGRLARIEARVDEQTRVFPVVVEVEEPLNVNRTVTRCRSACSCAPRSPAAASTDAVRIPQSALHGDDDVFLFVDGQLQRRSVTVGRISDGNALVTAGLEDGDRVVTTRLDLMFEGMQVALIDG